MEDIIRYILIDLIETNVGLIMRFLFIKFIRRRKITIKQLTQEDSENRLIGSVVIGFIVISFVLCYVFFSSKN
jgi:hypothetical protein